MNHVEIIDNFLPVHQFKKLQATLNDATFPWFLGDVLSEDDTEAERKYNKQMYHLFYYTPNKISDAMPVLQDLYNKLNIGIFVKAKANLNFATEETIEHGMHEDIVELTNIMTTSIFYVNTNNGYTRFKNGQKVESVENRLVRFPANTLHTGSTCTDEPFRIVLNLNYIENKNA